MLIIDQKGKKKTLPDYEYTIRAIPSNAGGTADLEKMNEIIQFYANDGWKLHTVYSNNVGVNQVRVMGVGVNSNMSEDIMIFERHTQYTDFDLSEDIVFPVINYAESISIRFGEVFLKAPLSYGKVFLALSGKMFNHVVIDALRVNIEFQTIFNESIHINNATFISVMQSSDTFQTEFFEFPMDRNDIQLLKSAKVFIAAYVENGNGVTPDSIQYTDIDCDLSELTRQRSIFGLEYVGDAQNLGDKWRCICGKTNPKTVEKCILCGRSMEGEISVDLSTLDEILNRAKGLENAKKILQYVESYNEKYDSDLLNELLADLRKAVSTEKRYAVNNKRAAIQYIETMIDSMS